MEHVNEFIEIIQNLDMDDLLIFQKALTLSNEKEQRVCLKESKHLNGALYNAYCARVLVEDPTYYIKKEIDLRQE